MEDVLSTSCRMFSVPAVLDYPSPSSVVEDDLGEQDDTVWKIYRWNTETGSYSKYPDIPDITPGKAFWIITRDSKSIDVGSGDCVDTSSDYAVSLSQGWNQIGSPFLFSVDFEDVKVKKGPAIVSIQQAQENGWVRDKIWYWDGLTYVFYRAPDGTLDPWEGYWVKALVSDCELLIPPVKAKESAKILSQALAISKENYLQITAKVGDLKDTCNFIGLSGSAEDGYDREDVEEAPPISPYISLYFPHEDWGKNNGFTPRI